MQSLASATVACSSWRETDMILPSLKTAGMFLSALQAIGDKRKSRFYQLQDLSLHWETARGLRGEKPGLISNKTIRWLLQAHWAHFPAEGFQAKTMAKMNFVWCIDIKLILSNARPTLISLSASLKTFTLNALMTILQRVLFSGC